MIIIRLYLTMCLTMLNFHFLDTTLPVMRLAELTSCQLSIAPEAFVDDGVHPCQLVDNNSHNETKVVVPESVLV